MSRDLQPANFQIDYGSHPGGKNQFGALNRSATEGTNAKSAINNLAYQPYLNEINIVPVGTTATTQNALSFAPSGTPTGLTQPFLYGAGLLVTTTTNNLGLLPSTNSRQPQTIIVFDNRILKDWTELQSSINGTGAGVAGMSITTGTSITSFNGTTQYLSVAEATPGTTLSFGLGQFTIDGWLYRTATATSSTFAAKSAATAQGWIIYVSSANLVIYNDSVITITGSTTVQFNTWYHVAVSRNSTNITRLFVNGALESTATSTANLNQTDVLRIGAGRTGVTTNYWRGSISHFRLSKSALFTATFSFTNTSVSPVSMPVTSVSTSNTALLACVSSTSTSINYTAVFNAAANNYLTIPYGSKYNIEASIPFSFEAWVYTTSSSPFFMASRNWSYGGTGPTWSFWLTNGITPRMSIAGTGEATYIMGTSTLFGTLGTWTHYAFSRNSANVFTIFVNGAVGYTRGPDVQSTSSFTSASGNIFIGAPSNLAAYSTGYISNIRFVVGNTVYTGGAFTVPPIPFAATSPASTNINAITTETVLLTLQGPDFGGNINNNVGFIQFENTATGVAAQYVDLARLYGTLTTVASTITGNISPLVSSGTISITYTNTSVLMSVPLYNYPNTSSWSAGATIPYHAIGQTGNASSLTNRIVDRLEIEPSSQIFFKDNRFKPINNINSLQGFGFFGNNRNFYPGIQEFDSALTIPVLNNNPYQTLGIRAIPTSYMSFNNPTISVSLTINPDAGIYVAGAGAGAIGGSSAIFITSAYVNPEAGLTPSQSISRLRQVWTAN